MGYSLPTPNTTKVALPSTRGVLRHYLRADTSLLKANLNYALAYTQMPGKPLFSKLHNTIVCVDAWYVFCLLPRLASYLKFNLYNEKVGFWEQRKTWSLDYLILFTCKHLEE